MAASPNDHPASKAKRGSMRMHPAPRKYLLAAVAAVAIAGPAHAGDATLDALTDNANQYTNAAAILLASQEMCGYTHEMLAQAIIDLKRNFVIDDKLVVAIAYRLNVLADTDDRYKNVVCSGAMKMVDDDRRDHQR
jgi:hypothetical protein